MRLLSALLLLAYAPAEAMVVSRAPLVRWRAQAVATGAPFRPARLSAPEAPSSLSAPAVWTPLRLAAGEFRPTPLVDPTSEPRLAVEKAPESPEIWSGLFDGVLSPKEKADAARIAGFLAEQETIRVFMGDAPGNGHQSASATAMKRLRELGFAGRFEVVFQPGVRSKLAKLLPGFNLWAGNQQTLEGLGLVTIPEERFLRSKKDRVRLAITGADDYENPRADGMAADYFLVLQPQDWPEEATLQVHDGDTVELPELSELGYVYRVAAPADISSFVKDEMAHDGALAAKVPGLVEVLSRKEHHLLPAYGLGIKGVKKLDRLVKALSSARPALGGKGVVVPLISSLSDEEVSQLKARLGAPKARRSFLGWLARTQRKAGGEDASGVKVLSIRDAGLREALDGLGAGEILVVLTGPVTQNVFEYLFSQATLPATVAGKNASNLMRLLGKPYLNTVADYPDLNGDALSAEERRLVGDAHGALAGSWRRGKIADLAAFIVAALDPDSRLSRFYKSQSPLDAPIAKDKLAQGLLRVVALAGK